MELINMDYVACYIFNKWHGMAKIFIFTWN